MNKTLPILLVLVLVGGLGFLFMNLARNETDTQATSQDTSPEEVVLDDTRPVILAFGDSLTAGFGLSESESYPSQLQDYLDRNGYDYRVINAGLSGDTSAGAANRIEFSLEDNPEIIIVTIGGNDLLRGLPLDQLRTNIASIIEASQEAGTKVVLSGMQAPANLDSAYRTELIALYQELAREYDTAFIPFFLEGVALNPAINQSDQIHPTKEGYGIILEQNILPVLEPLLERAN